MDNALNLPNANSYWNVLKDLSNEAKLELIARLSNSLLNKEEEKKTSASSLNEEIKASRKFKNDIEAF